MKGEERLNFDEEISLSLIHDPRQNKMTTCLRMEFFVILLCPFKEFNLAYPKTLLNDVSRKLFQFKLGVVLSFIKRSI